MRILISTLTLAACLALGACADEIPGSTLLADRGPTAAPAGWVNYCHRHAEDSGCR
jgi:predicted transglutaminase-like cysteine proteinase